MERGCRVGLVARGLLVLFLFWVVCQYIVITRPTIAAASDVGDATWVGVALSNQVRPHDAGNRRRIGRCTTANLSDWQVYSKPPPRLRLAMVVSTRA